MALVDYEKRLEKAERLLDKADISKVNKDLLRRFVEFRAAGRVTVARQVKCLIILRLIAQKFYLKDKDF
jgi:hypothetical protein